MRSEIKQLAFDLASGHMAEGFTKESGENVIREKIKEACGGEFNFYSFKEHQWACFAILAEVLTVATNYLQMDAYSDLVEFKDVELGDKIVFEVENTELYKVSQIALGVNDLQRQRIVNKKIPTVEFNLGVRIYEELALFMAGRVDFAKMIVKVSKSFDTHVAGLIANAIYSSYDALKAPFVTSGQFKSEVLLDLVSEVETATGENAVIMGTKKALSHLIKDLTDAPESVKEAVYNSGMIGKYMGVPVYVLPQAKNAKGENVAQDDVIIVVPNGERIVKFAWIGSAFMTETNDGTANTLQQIEFMFQRGAAIAVIVAAQYGMYRVS